MKRSDWVLVLMAFVSAGAYVGLAASRGVVGFPLDDAWIHQVYARNLGMRGEFAFFTGQLSAGSTSPLWTILLALGYLLRIDFRVWAYLLGVVLLGASAITASRLVDRLSSFLSASYAAPAKMIVPMFLLFEWHLAWSAASGMEILLFVLLALVLLARFYAGTRSWLLGALAGLLTLTRPEGMVLAGLVGLGLLWQTWELYQHKQETRIDFGALTIVAIQFIAGFALVLAPDLIFNFIVGGTLLPNTFYAKTAEYAILFEQSSLFARWWNLSSVSWTGAQILLGPGAIYLVIALARRRAWLALIPFAWILLLPALYAIRLPVVYQHGRYEMPTIPFIALYGVCGTAALLARLNQRLVRATWALSTVAVLIVFWLLGAAQYANDVAIIDCEMVGTAQWVAANVPPDAVIAAHDIGALGYYWNHPFIDLAGLVSPDVIPFLRDESRLRDYLFSRQAAFVIVFPDWYPMFDADARFVRADQTDCAVTRAAGEKNMIVYRLVR